MRYLIFLAMWVAGFVIISLSEPVTFWNVVGSFMAYTGAFELGALHERSK